MSRPSGSASHPDDKQIDACEPCRRRSRWTTVILRIVPNSMIATWANHQTHLGFSLIPGDGRFGYMGGVYFNRAEELAQRLGRDRSLVLGVLLAHELGYLLLGANSHSPNGIMCYPLGWEQVELAAQGRLRFGPSQVLERSGHRSGGGARRRGRPCWQP